jgi:hypothetical protein
MKKQSKVDIALPEFKKIVTPDQRLAVAEAAIADGHNMDWATHAVMKDDKIVGGWCLGGVPLALCWHHTKKVNRDESLHINGVVGSIMNDRGVGTYMIACDTDSPFYNHMARFGYHPVWPTNLFYKRTS